MERKRLKNSRYITGFNGLRSLAVIAVILYHLLPATMRGGYLGVLVFFVVSGYLITDLLCQEWQQYGKINLWQFYARRVKRLYPALIICLITSTAYITLFQRSLLNNLRGNVFSALAYVNNWWQIKHGLSYFDRFAGESPFTHLWYLAVEFQNYLIWPLLFIVLMKVVRNRAKIGLIVFGGAVFSAILMAILYTPGGDPTRVYYGTDTRLFSIWIGSALAFIWPSTRLKAHVPLQAKRILNVTGLVALIILIVSFFFMGDRWTFNYYGGMFLISLICMIIVALTAHPGANLNRWLTNPIFDWIGKRSYGIYLYQYPVMIFYEAKINVANHPLLNTLVELLLILVISDLSYRFVERPTRNINLEWIQAKIRGLVQYPLNNRQKVNLTVSGLVLATAVIGLIMAPTNQVTAGQKELEEKIAANKKAAEKTRESETTDSKEAAKATSSNPDLARFGLNSRQIAQGQKLEITAFGDSVVLGAADNLQEIFPKIVMDGDVGRTVQESPALLQQLKDKKLLKDTVLISLGTNAAFSESEFDAVMEVLGSKRQVYWMNTYVPTKRWQNEVNGMLPEMAKKYKNLTILDWYSYSSPHPEWFYEDQVHPNPDGSIEYCSFVAKNILEPK